MKRRAIGDIVLHPSNDHGVYYFISLQTGRRININQWTVLTITQEVIDRVDW